MLSKTSIYAIRALLFISLNGKDGFVLIREMSEKLNISFHFLTKILQKLKDNRIVKSHQGPKGGVSFAKSPGKTLIKFSVFDQTTNIKLHLFSRTRRIGLSGELKAYLQKNPDIVFTIN